MLADSLAEVFALPDEHRQSLLCAALTMNVAMTALQDELALQRTPPARSSAASLTRMPQPVGNCCKKSGDGHPLAGRGGLCTTPLEGPEALADWEPAKRLAKILQTVDRYTAAMSPQVTRRAHRARLGENRGGAGRQHQAR